MYCPSEKSWWRLSRIEGRMVGGWVEAGRKVQTFIQEDFQEEECGRRWWWGGCAERDRGENGGWVEAGRKGQM
jgi:hypothetical protein